MAQLHFKDSLENVKGKKGMLQNQWDVSIIVYKKDIN